MPREMNYIRSNRILKWWRDIDNIALILVIAIVLAGILLIATASPPVAERIGLHPFYFLHKHFIYLLLSITVIIFFSAASEVIIKRFCLLTFCFTLVLLTAVLIAGEEIKGAKRWITLIGFSLQPSELLKPFYAVVVALILSGLRVDAPYKKFIFCIIIHVIVITLILLQPDFGMSVTISLVTAGQFFVAGLSLIWIISSCVIFIIGAFCAYTFFPHVKKRIEMFLSDDASSNYQVAKSLESYIQGGFLGKGPGEGTVKLVLPDAHTDFIFAVASEEFGALFCFVIIALFATVVLRGILRLTLSQNLFHIYAATGILMYFAIQSIFNIGVTLHLFPTKGMTLPFISYGGSSMLSFSCAMGIYLSLTKRTEKSYLSPGYTALRKQYNYLHLTSP